MNVTTNEFAREFYMTKLRGILEGSVTVPSLTLEYTLDPEVMHCSEAELCPARAYYRRTVKPSPPMSDRAVLTFMRGRLFERFLADELPATTKDGISGRVDGLLNGNLIETKSTASDMGNFNPITKYPHWLQRSKAYCTLHEKTKIILVVWFLVGDMWSKKTIQTGLKCWDLEFTEEELAHNWEHMTLERDRLMACVQFNRFPGEAWIRSRLNGGPGNRMFECPDCVYNDICQYPSKGGKK